MAGSLATGEIRAFLKRLGGALSRPNKVFLLGGSALCYLGSPRRTGDIDITLGVSSEEIRREIEGISNELRLDVEIVPIEEFIPLPEGASTRHRKIETHGALSIYIYDPYSIALSKVARGFESDLQDVLFMLHEGLIHIEQLKIFVEQAQPYAWDFDIDPADLQRYFAEIQKRYP